MKICWVTDKLCVLIITITIQDNEECEERKEREMIRRMWFKITFDLDG